MIATRCSLASSRTCKFIVFGAIALTSASSIFAVAAADGDQSSTQAVPETDTRSVQKAAPMSAAKSAANSAPGSVQGSPGSAGMEDNEGILIKEVKRTAKRGTASGARIGALIDLGMYYNRQERYPDAEHALQKALALIDSGALKPSTEPIQSTPQPIMTYHRNGTVSAAVYRQPPPYEETLAQLLPALLTAEIANKDFKKGDLHAKRLIAIAQSGRVPRVPHLMFAYHQYAELLRKQGRPQEADQFQQKADQINHSIKGL